MYFAMKIKSIKGFKKKFVINKALPCFICHLSIHKVDSPVNSNEICFFRIFGYSDRPFSLSEVRWCQIGWCVRKTHTHTNTHVGIHILIFVEQTNDAIWNSEIVNWRMQNKTVTWQNIYKRILLKKQLQMQRREKQFGCTLGWNRSAKIAAQAESRSNLFVIFPLRCHCICHWPSAPVQNFAELKECHKRIIVLLSAYDKRTLHLSWCSCLPLDHIRQISHSHHTAIYTFKVIIGMFPLFSKPLLCV